MSIVVVDNRGRIVIPSRIRKKLGLKRGDVLLVLELENNLVVLRKIDVENLVKDLAKYLKESDLDFERIEQQIEEEANRLAEKKIHD